MLCARLMVRSKYTILGIPPEILSPRISAAFDAIVYATNGLYILNNHRVSLKSWWYSFLWNKGHTHLHHSEVLCRAPLIVPGSRDDDGVVEEG